MPEHRHGASESEWCGKSRRVESGLKWTTAPGVGLFPLTMSAPTSIVSRLAAFSSCEVADALIKLKLPQGGYLPGIEMFSPQHIAGPTRVCGPAFTVKVRFYLIRSIR